MTAYAKLEPTDRVQHVVCEARNEVIKVTKMMITYLSIQVTSVPLRSEVFVAAAKKPPTSSKPLDPTQPPRAQAQEDKRRKV